MANKDHLKIIKQGVKAWNDWRKEEPDMVPHLSRADLRKAELSGAHLSGANLNEANLSEANLNEADLSEANLNEAELNGAHLIGAALMGADLMKAKLDTADLVGADLSRADLSGADLMWADLTAVDLSEATLGDADLRWVRFANTGVFGADFSGAKVGSTVFGDLDLSGAKGLDAVIHDGPSTIGIDTLYRSQGRISEVFLRGAGVLEEFITQVPALVASVSPIQFQSCFISYSHQDEEFARRLHSAMRSENLRVWFAPEEMKGGKKLHEQIFQAIQVHDRLLLVLSKDSMKSEWVITEIRRAKKVEREDNRRKLFPIRLVDFETIQSWECFDADSGKDLAAEVREYYILISLTGRIKIRLNQNSPNCCAI